MSKEAIEHYEAALKEAFPSGATGNVFHHWNEARKALAEQPAPMSQPNRVIAYSATTKLRELGYEWVDGEWKQPAQQEPVALPCCGYTNASAIKWNPYNQVVQCHNCGQVYTTPQAQRTWVGLTDDEVIDIAGSSDYRYDVARAAEAKLKEKNT